MNQSAPPDWEVLLAPFQSLFSRAGYRYFVVFVRTFAHLDGRLWVTQAVLSGLLGRHWTNFYRFLRSPVWSEAAVRATLWRLCLAVVTAGGRVFVAIDDTVCAKGGRCFAGLGVHHDPMNRAHPKHLSRGHCWVCLAVLARQGAAHWAALFVGCALYLQRKACGAGQEFATKLQLAVRLLCALPEAAGLLVVAVADGAYARRGFVEPVCASGRHVLSRLRRDAVFYDPPPPRLPGQRGRPRRFGAKHKAAEWAAQTEGWQAAELCLYGRSQTVRLKSRQVLLRCFGVNARLVAVRWPNRATVFLFCTDATMTPAQVAEAYAARFAIETGFRDAKQGFGLSTYQVRNPVGFTRLVHLCLWAQTLLRLRCWDCSPADGEYGGWRKPLDYRTLTQQKRLSQEHDAFLRSPFSGGTVAEKDKRGVPLETPDCPQPKR